MKSDRTDVDGVGISHPDRIVFPSEGITKLDLARYYDAVADWMLPHIADRPLSVVRVLDTVDGQQFFQRHLPKHGGLRNVAEVPVPVRGRIEHYMAVEDKLGLLSLSQWGCIEFHPWGCHADKPLLPDRMIFDLDPDPQAPWRNVIEGAAEVRERLRELGLKSFLKTTGGKGLHVVVPIERRFGWPAAKALTHAIAESMARDSPDRFVANMSKARRKGRIFIDYLRNDLTSTAVSAFSVRARPGANVSTPLNWSELATSLDPKAFNLRTVPARLKALKADPWSDYFALKQGIRPDVLNALHLDVN